MHADDRARKTGQIQSQRKMNRFIREDISFRSIHSLRPLASAEEVWKVIRRRRNKKVIFRIDFVVDVFFRFCRSEEIKIISFFFRALVHLRLCFAANGMSLTEMADLPRLAVNSL